MIKKQKKKKKGKKVTVETACDSFFHIFNNLDSKDSEEFPKKEETPKKVDEDEDEDSGDEITEKLTNDLEVADMIKEDIIPLALEYYLGVIEVE
jgi:hypothetical protein